MQKQIIMSILGLFGCLQAAPGPEQLKELFRQIPPVEVKIGLSGSIGQELTQIISNSGDAVNSNVSNFFETIGKSLPKMGPGFIKLGGDFAQAIKPIQGQMLKGTAAFAGIALAGAIAQNLSKKYIAKYLFEPALIERRSSYSFAQRIKSLIKSPAPVDLSKHMVISEQLKTELEYIMAMTTNIKKHGGEYENILLYGLPGTGKTLFAQLLAEHCGMDYAIIPAANISQFMANGTVVEELNNLFAWAASNNRGTLLFFDETETFLADRSTLNAAAQNALGIFLAKTGTPSKKIMIMGATNRPEVLDAAALSRFGMRVEFPLPDQAAREDQLKLHIAKTFGVQKGTIVSYAHIKDKAVIVALAEKLDGHSGRTIQKFVNRMRQQALAQNMLSITPDLLEQVLAQLKREQKLIVVPPAA